MKVEIIRVDPYHPVLGLVTSIVAQRLLESFKQLDDEPSAVANLMSRLWAGDPTVLVLACLDPKGKVKGHAAASIAGQEVYLVQPKLDEPTENDAIAEMLASITTWVRSYNSTNGYAPVTRLTLVVHRSDPKWAKRHGFETVRYVMRRPLEGAQNV